LEVKNFNSKRRKGDLDWWVGETEDGKEEEKYWK